MEGGYVERGIIHREVDKRIGTKTKLWYSGGMVKEIIKSNQIYGNYYKKDFKKNLVFCSIFFGSGACFIDTTALGRCKYAFGKAGN